jgi:hypothetical protein
MSYYGMPDAQKQSYMQNIQRSGQQALSGVADRKGGLGMVSAIQQQQEDSYMNLLSADVQQRMQNIRAAQEQRQIMANYKDKEFQINKMDPYVQDYNEAQAQIGAGMQNIMGGIQSGAQSMMLSKAYDLQNQKTTNTTANTTTNATNVIQDPVVGNIDGDAADMAFRSDVNPATGTTKAQYDAAQQERMNFMSSAPKPEITPFIGPLESDIIPYGGYKPIQEAKRTGVPYSGYNPQAVDVGLPTGTQVGINSFDNRVVPQIFSQGTGNVVGQVNPNVPMGPPSFNYNNLVPQPVDGIDYSLITNANRPASQNPFQSPSLTPGGITGLLYPELMPNGVPYGGYNPQPLNFGLPTGTQINNLAPLNNY